MNLEKPENLLEDRGKTRKPVSRWLVAGFSGCILNTILRFYKQKYVVALEVSLTRVPEVLLII
jgi:hypothetical protein